MGLLGNGFDDPRSSAVMGLASGLLQGNFGAGLLGANQAYGQAKQDAVKQQLMQLQMQQAQQGLQKGGIELQQMQQQVERANRIRDELARQQMGAMSAQPAVPQLNTPEVGGIPMFSRGTTQDAAAPAPTQTQPGSNLTRAVSERLIQQANVYSSNGDFEGANKLLEHAAKFMPEVKEMGVLMRNGQPVNVITYKDGTQQITDLAPTPKVHYLDSGGRIQPINEYTQQPLGSPTLREQTPDSRASNAVAIRGQNLTDARAREANMQSRIPAGYRPAAGGGLEYIPGGPADPNSAKKAAPTEFQGKSTTFAARMQDAAKVLDDLEGKVWPSTVARAGYKPEFPGWMPGGQVLGGALAGVNRSTVPADAQRYYQAQENWVTANLRQESGAAIGKDEMAKDIAKWFPQPGDSEDVIRQKAAARKVAERAMVVQAGPGASSISDIVGGGASQPATVTNGVVPDWKYVNGKLVRVK